MSDVVVTRVGRVLVATINRADRGNSIGGRMMAELLAAANEAENDDSVGVMVLASTGRIWCSGGDPSELGRGFGPGADANRLIHHDKLGGENGLPALSDQAVQFDKLGINAWLPLYRECGKPMIAALGGIAIGGGFALSLCHDMRIGSHSMRVRPGFAGLGVGPELGTSWNLPQIVGPSQAAEMLLSDRWVGAQEALRLGLISELVPDEQLLDRTVEIADSIASRPAETVRSVIRALRDVHVNSLEQQLRLEWDLFRARATPPG